MRDRGDRDRDGGEALRPPDLLRERLQSSRVMNRRLERHLWNRKHNQINTASIHLIIYFKLTITIYEVLSLADNN